jgi:hypothetical protein
VDHNSLKELARALGRPVKTLYALSHSNDPFFVAPARQRAAEWFAEVWHGLDIGRAHYRRIYYRLISLAEPVLMANGQPFIGSHKCWADLNVMARDAAYLGLVPPEAYEDRRNAEPLIMQEGLPTPASCHVENDELVVARIDERLYMPRLPRLQFTEPSIPQPYQVEIWVEKTTVNDVIEPLARHYNLNVQTGVGQLSAILCRELVDRMQEHGRPTRVLYISDFDPAGDTMPVAVAVKVQYELHRLGLDDLDIQVRPVALTYEQCVEYQLPRSPVKDSDRGAPAFAARYGSGITELDALEAIHPGLLRRILVREIERYRDPDHAEVLAAACQEAEDEVRRVTDEVHQEHAGETAPLLTEYEVLQAEYDEFVRTFQAKLAAWTERAEPVWQAIADDLEELAPDVDELRTNSTWLANEDDDPLFDSSREYLDQVDRFKRYQGKPTGRRGTPSMNPGAIRMRQRRAKLRRENG